jgi:hypothetical protein
MKPNPSGAGKKESSKPTVAPPPHFRLPPFRRIPAPFRRIKHSWTLTPRANSTTTPYRSSPQETQQQAGATSKECQQNTKPVPGTNLPAPTCLAKPRRPPKPPFHPTPPLSNKRCLAPNSKGGWHQSQIPRHRKTPSHPEPTARQSPPRPKLPRQPQDPKPLIHPKPTHKDKWCLAPISKGGWHQLGEMLAKGNGWGGFREWVALFRMQRFDLLVHWQVGSNRRLPRCSHPTWVGCLTIASRDSAIRASRNQHD